MNITETINLLHSLLSSLPTTTTNPFIWAIGTIVTWYLFYAFTLAMNGGGNPIRTFFTQDILWYLPGGLKRRAEYVKKIVKGASEHSSTMGSKRTWTDKEVVEGELYEEFAKDVLQGPVSFWIMSVIIPIAAGHFSPIFIYILVVVVVLSVFAYLAVEAKNLALKKLGLQN